MPLRFRAGIISSVGGFWLGVPPTRLLFVSHNFFATARKIIYAACLIQAGRFLLVEINNTKVQESSHEFGEERGLLYRTMAGN